MSFARTYAADIRSIQPFVHTTFFLLATDCWEGKILNHWLCGNWRSSVNFEEITPPPDGGGNQESKSDDRLPGDAVSPG